MRGRLATSLAALLLAAALAGCGRTPTGAASSPAAAPRQLVAKTYNSGFERAHDTYNGISAAGDGRIYYALSTDAHDVGARMFSYDPATGRIRRLGDLTEACGETALKAISQGKVHVGFVESRGKLYFATHIGYYSIIDI